MLFGATTTDVIIVLATILPIFILMIVAFSIALVKKIKIMRKYKKNQFTETEDQRKNELLLAFGDNNIVSINKEMSRVIVEVKDVDLVKPEELKRLGANSVYIAGNVVKCSYQDADSIHKMLAEGVNGKEQ